MSAGLAVQDLVVRYRAGAGRQAPLVAVAGVSFTLAPGEALGLVGESGCGKSSLARALLGLVAPSGGTLHWRGRRIDRLGRRHWRPLRAELQMVFQDPFAGFDPRLSVGRSVAEPLRALRPALAPAGRWQRVLALFTEVGLAPALAERYPHELSGGQLQRAMIARALAPDPALLVCDEPVSALDVPVQAQIVALLGRIRRERALATLVISHNLAIVERLCDQVLVMYGGRIVEQAPCPALLQAPLHPYTRLLLDAVPEPDPGWWPRRRARFQGGAALAPAAPATAPGCAFAARCPQRDQRCERLAPRLGPAGAARQVACHRAGEWPAGL